MPATELKVGIAGLGTIGLPVARWLDAAGKDLGLTLAGVAARDEARAAERIASLASPPPVLGLAELVEASDIVLEVLPPERFAEVAYPAVEAGRILMPLSVTQLLEHWDLVAIAGCTGARIIVPTGALIGFDAVRAAAKARIDSVTMVTRKPPRGLQKAPFVQEQGLDLLSLSEPMKLYEGSVREAARMFPANVNVAVALSLAGIGPDRTCYQVWADPGVDRNTHEIEVEADVARFSMRIAIVPTEENPATGQIVAPSVIACLEGLVSPLRVGS